jgi:aspartate/methionine/tyrosine aminotransferase
MVPLLAFYSTHGVFPAAQHAALAATTGPQDAVQAMRAAYDQRRTLLLDGLAATSRVTVARPTGAFYVFANVAPVRGSRTLWELVDEWLTLGVASLPGTAFGPEHGDWVRLALCTRADDVAEAARRIARHAGA